MILAANEKILIQRLINLVNLNKIKDARQVEKLAENIVDLTVRVMSFGGDLNQALSLQGALRKALDDLLSRRQEAFDEVVRYVNGQLSHVQTGYRVTDQGDLIVLSGLLGCDAVFGYALALLLDRRRGLRTRLEKCALPGCCKFVMNFSQGRPQKYCSEGHRRAADKPESKRRSQEKRDKAKAAELLREGESIDFVCGALQRRLDKQEVERIQDRLKVRGAIK
jgi:hypothetical protein